MQCRNIQVVLVKAYYQNFLLNMPTYVRTYISIYICNYHTYTYNLSVCIHTYIHTYTHAHNINGRHSKLPLQMPADSIRLSERQIRAQRKRIRESRKRIAWVKERRAANCKRLAHSLARVVFMNETDYNEWRPALPATLPRCRRRCHCRVGCDKDKIYFLLLIYLKLLLFSLPILFNVLIFIVFYCFLFILFVESVTVFMCFSALTRWIFVNNGQYSIDLPSPQIRRGSNNIIDWN